MTFSAKESTRLSQKQVLLSVSKEVWGQDFKYKSSGCLWE